MTTTPWILATALTLLSTAAHADTWQLDPSHTRVGFRVSHMMVSSVEGQFPGVEGTIAYEPGQLDDLAVTVKVDLASVDTGNADRDAHLRTSDFLDVPNHPTMTFTSTRVVPGKKGAFDLHGDLTIRGVTQPVVLHATGLQAAVTDPWGNERLGAAATTTIDRKAFGVSWNQTLETGGLLVGDELELRIDVEFVRPATPKS